MNNFLDIIDNHHHIFEDLSMRHTKFQIENFVLGQEQGVTAWGKYKQVLRELNVRVRNLKESKYQIKKKEIEIKRLEKKLESAEDEIDKEEYLLDIENEQYNLKIMQQDKEEIIKEGSIFADSYNKLKAEIDKQLAERKTKEQLEEEYWVEKPKQDVQNSVLASSGASISLIRTIRGLSNENKVNEILKEYYQSQVSNLVDNKAISDQAIKLIDKNDS